MQDYLPPESATTKGLLESPVDGIGEGHVATVERASGATVARGAKALALAQILTQGSRLLTNIVLARLLIPEAFGLVAIAAVVIAFLDQFKDGGTGSAIIQAKEVTPRLLNTVFALNVVLGVLLSAILAGTAAPLADALNNPEATPVLRAFAAITFITSLGQIHHAILRRSLRFRTIAIISTISTLTTGVVSIVGAFAGWAVWSLVAGAVVGAVVDCALVWLNDRWRPHWSFSMESLRSIRSYSLNLFAGNVLSFFANQSDKIIVGRFLGALPLGLYSMAQRVLSYPLVTIGSVVAEVSFPAMAQRQNDNAAMRNAWIRSSQFIVLVTFPLMCASVVLARPLVQAVLGAKWDDITPLIWILSPVGAVQVLLNGASNLLLAKGRTDTMLKLTIATGVLNFSAYLVGVHWGLVGICTASAVAVVISAAPTCIVAFRCIEMPVWHYVRALLPITLFALIAAGCTWVLAWQVSKIGDDWVVLVSGSLLYLLVFVALVLATKQQAAEDAIDALRARSRSGHVPRHRA